MKPDRSLHVDSLLVNLYATRSNMGIAAAEEAVIHLKRLLTEHDSINVMFAAAPSQNEFLAALCESKEVDWTRVHAFHMDEYIALDKDAPQGFGNFLRERIFSRVPFASVSYLNGNAEDPSLEAERYAGLLEKEPLHVCFMGVGENGHVAFNDPPVANFTDPVLVKVVELEERCRLQQVHDGCFAAIEEVPTHALSVTVPGLMRAERVFCIVPAATKAEAIERMLKGAIETDCPASILRTHPNATLYLDPDSGSSLL